ncbi:type I secretion system permease/ATPase [Brevundimonas sp. Leaf363]|uniref:type I secretion system permease/ATPase n=1 Tax=Brevundimonas sp. Leaf363 TaxID=1736353 RepID=UPI001F284F87|nr:type I secretion system permease/ATPase [Brevundimonas sp. Leaf363]
MNNGQRLLPDASGAPALTEAVAACKRHFVVAGVFSALVNILYLTPTLYMMQVYNRVVPTGGLTTLALLTVIVLFALATLTALDSLRTRLLYRAGLRLDRLLAGAVLSRVVGSGRGRGHAGEAMRNLDSVRAALSGPGVSAAFDLPWTVVYLAVCFLLHPLIGLLSLAGAGILLALAVANEKATRPKLQASLKAASAAYAAQETLGSHAETVRALGMQRAMIGRQLAERETATVAQAQAQFSGGGFSGAIKFARLAMQSLALGLGAFLAVKGEISAGAIIASSVLLSRTVAPIEQIVGGWPNLIQGRTAWTNLVALFAGVPDPQHDRTELPRPMGRIEVENVSVRFAEGAEPQLKSISTRLEPGQILGIIGPSGSGKTTLSRVISGALRPGLGVVRLDGADYQAWDSDRLASHVGYLPQQPVLFAGTIKDNIARFGGDQKLSPVEIDAAAVAAAQAAGVHELILRLPQGYDTMLNADGSGLSAGQTQRIALARALYGEPALLVLDEPNSALDQEGEQALAQAVVAAAERGAAVVVVAHRAGFLQVAHRLLLMKNGQVEMQGSREDVLSRLNPKPGPRIASVQ